MSRVDHQRKSCKVVESLYQVFEASLSMYNEWITKEKVVKLRSHYIRCLKLRCLCLKSGSSRKSCKLAESLYQVSKVALSMNEEWITNQKVVKLLSLLSSV